ncbi:hypothetical protein BC749_108151 [Flavobacterium araucananum]|nr:hypothetical protein BC749_108151 [Flavobacterium araucananum]
MGNTEKLIIGAVALTGLLYLLTKTKTTPKKVIL